ncbi:hypothetical protein LTSEMON_3446 [Salmonella enterica subsp. enterica serovar Montevideo str. S5-403]|uniref:Uncharacterized protein n=1 Tax=Salmonella enterica subsp. enterica serovar Montevideo str. S5-403 TaxID=913242 RepID=G5Q5K1_SALMO|nr:hypothetical protein LTSEMON_3446 [Salmonella enterica subsp. enterica serovar Montevideo str. S5-403]
MVLPVHSDTSHLPTAGKVRYPCCVVLINTVALMISSRQTRPIQRLLVFGLAKVAVFAPGAADGVDIG